jgi:hypothetical protein
MVVLGWGAVSYERGTPVASSPGSEESGCRVEDLDTQCRFGYRIQGVGFRVWGLGYGV